MSVSEDPAHGQLTRVFRRVFDEPDLIIFDEMTAADVEQWDSLTHINLITAIEKEFKIRFTTAEIMGIENIGALEALIRRKLGA